MRLVAKPYLRAVAAFERLRESLWLIPGLMVASAATLALILVRSDGAGPDVPLREALLPATAEAAAPVLQVVATSVMTVTSVVFSLTVVALQITAGNYSPRALRTFLRDLGTQLVLGTFLATFIYSYIVLQNIQSIPGMTLVAWAPQEAFLVVPVFVLASLIALVFFIHHVTQAIRVDLILRQVLDESLDSTDAVHPARGSDAADKHLRDLIPDRTFVVTSQMTGFVQSFGVGDLQERMEQEDLVVAFRPSVGDHVLEGATLAWVWKTDGEPVEQLEADICTAIQDAVQVGRERSMDHDVAYSIRQLVDIAVRAMSPGVNDPNTAVAAILHLSVAYRRLLSRQLGPVVKKDERGEARIVIPYPSLSEYLTIMVQQVGHYGRADIMIVLRLLRVLSELKSLSDAHDGPALDQAIDEILREAKLGLDVPASLKLAREAARDAKDQKFRLHHYTAAG